MNPIAYTYTLLQIARLASRINVVALVEILMEAHPDILKEIINAHPEIIQAPKPRKEEFPEWAQEILNSYRHYNVVSAIKCIRSVFNCGLKEAKYVSDVLRGTQGIDTLNAEELSIYKCLPARLKAEAPAAYAQGLESRPSSY